MNGKYNTIWNQRGCACKSHDILKDATSKKRVDDLSTDVCERHRRVKNKKLYVYPFPVEIYKSYAIMMPIIIGTREYLLAYHYR